MNNFIEEWKDVPTWEGIYQCSNYGRIKRFFKHKDGSVTIRFPKIYLSKKDGYCRVQLRANNRIEKWLVHRLVATTWQRPLLDTEDAHHKNKMKCCNCNFNIQIKDSYQHESDHSRGRKFSQQTKNAKREKMLKYYQQHPEEGQRRMKLCISKRGKRVYTKEQRQSKSIQAKNRKREKGRFVKSDK